MKAVWGILIVAVALLAVLVFNTERAPVPIVLAPDFDLGPYHIQPPAAFSPWIGQPGDPRRSKYVVLSIPPERLGLIPPQGEASRPVSSFVVTLQLEENDAKRLAGYRDVMLSPNTAQKGDYLGEDLRTVELLYVKSHPGYPRYIVCPWRLRGPGPIFPTLCSTNETVVSAGHGALDLNISYPVREDYWPQVAQLSAVLKSMVIGFVSVRAP